MARPHDAPATIDFGEILTDASGEIKLHEQGQRLYPGEFTIEEVAPAPGFQLKEPTTPDSYPPRRREQDGAF